MKLSTRLDRIKKLFGECIGILERFDKSGYSMEKNTLRLIKNEMDVVGLRLKHFTNLIKEKKEE
tara:strand:+ start:89 stop:280 length:192 start_codon:yes stop_codon:yes gene_type:complete